MDGKTVKYHLDHFYRENPAFGSEGGIDEKWVWLEFGFIKVPFPNFKSRSDIIYLHDVNHIINDYDTSWKGEVSVAAWEVSTGMGRFLVGWFFATFAFGFGVITYPQATYRAFMRGRVTKSLFRMELPKERLLKMSLGELRQLTKHDQPRVVFQPGLRDNFLYTISATISLVFFMTPFLALIAAGVWFLDLI